MALITLQEAKDFLNITASTSDSELTAFTEAASSMWLARGLPGGPTARTETYDGGASRIALRHTPVVSVTSIAEAVGNISYPLTEQPLGQGGTSAYGFTYDPWTGVVVRRTAGAATLFADGIDNVSVVYTAGYATVPEDIKHAIKLLTKHLWDTQRGGAKRPGSGGDEQVPTTFSWPYRVEEIASAYTGPSVA
jgi:hypothetical protein